MRAQKWDPYNRTYTPYELPEGYTKDSVICRCASCGKFIKPEEVYTSLEIYDPIGIAYNVCPECYDKEVKRRLDAEKSEE